ncbi:MAG: hypothetical protein EAX87_00380 [Candidatus Thorarchaeota archaeon]|nr:hypothetical protein [Candidatus Thorarchaeota archaeon]
MQKTSYIPIILSIFLVITLACSRIEIGFAETGLLDETYQDSGPPVISTEPADLSYVEGTTGNTLYWEYSDENLAAVELYLDGTMIFIDNMVDNPTSLTWNIDGLSVGAYNYTLLLDDMFSQHSTSTVFVTVVVDAYSPPIVNHPLFVIFFAGDPTANCTWIASDSDPDTYTVYRNGTEMVSGSWTSGIPIIVPLSSLQFGVYNITIVLEDDIGNTASDTVIAYVLPSTLTPTPPPFFFETVIIIGIGITLGVVVLVAILAKRRVR